MYEIINVSVTKLRKYEQNPRNNQLAIEKVIESIKRFGFLFPLVIDENYTIVCGHTRLDACKKLNITSIPCITIDNLSPEQINFFRLVDNKTCEYADWDFAKLKTELSLINLNVESNALLLRTFDLDTEPTALDVSVPQIAIESVNFDSIMPTKKANSAVNGNIENMPIEDISYDAETYDAVSDDPAEIIKKKQSPSVGGLSAKYFRLGEILFFISDKELDMLNSVYAQYMDKIYPTKSFAQYLLEGL